jgi:hypothetical protein
MQPKVFISYSWSSPNHQILVKEWADRLIADGIDVSLDIYDLKEGHDKFVFMEKMVTDINVTHVLVICDKKYSEKANARKAGVGIESQIISKEVYEKVEQSKFIPIVCEYTEDEKPILPIFMESRIYVDFSSPEKVNANWEQLVRLIFDKPLHEKPKLGKPPVYITNDINTPSSPAIAKFNTFKQALLQDKKGLSMYRRDFLEACIDYADTLRVRERPDVSSLGQKIIEDCGKLKLVRNQIIDWVLLESQTSVNEEFCRSLIDFLEKLRELKSRPENINQWNDAWFDAHGLFVYETFLYIVAALLKTNSYHILHEIFTTHYLNLLTDRYNNDKFDTFTCFWTYSDALKTVLFPPNGGSYYSPAAELFSRQADREDLPFSAIIEAELLILLMFFINPSAYHWHPGTLYYSSYNKEFLFFTRATQHKGFLNLATITGINDANSLREKVKEGIEQKDANRWSSNLRCSSFWRIMNMDKLDTLK